MWCQLQHNLYHEIILRETTTGAEFNIHLRARTQDRKLIDQAAELVWANRSQFMVAAALKEAKNILLDQSNLYADAKTFQKVMDWMDTPTLAPDLVNFQKIG